MVHFNADGGRAELCVNGTRCAARLALHLGWATSRLTVLTDAGPVEARTAGAERVALALPPPESPPEPRRLEAGGRTCTGWWIRIGVPHFVVAWPESLAAAPVASLGAELRRHPAFGDQGVNVDFVRFPARDRLEIRTFERGVEAETLACGTGVLAAAAVGLATGRLDLPLTALTRGGFELGVEGRLQDRTPVEWELIGDARIISEGALLQDADRVPPTPTWSGGSG